jgi:hypothetical protein
LLSREQTFGSNCKALHFSHFYSVLTYTSLLSLNIISVLTNKGVETGSYFHLYFSQASFFPERLVFAKDFPLQLGHSSILPEKLRTQIELKSVILPQINLTT